MSADSTIEPVDEPPAASQSGQDPLPHEVAAATLEQLQQELNRLQRTIRLAIQAKLAQLAGRSMGSLQQNRELAKSLHELLDGHGLRVMCSECGCPAILRVSPRRGSADGVFVFDHTIDGRRTFHGGRSTMPELHLIAKPLRQTRRAAG
tara:strand:- start:39393 stop:39839 length:447 start_codon:yes stop_codon:yes gene_type:complete